jgi:hypothetical protein
MWGLDGSIWADIQCHESNAMKACPFFEKAAKSSFQGSLYLSRESLGNHFFEE